MKGVIFENYRGMQIECYPLEKKDNADANKIEINWMVEAKYNNETKGSWEYTMFKVDPNNQDINSRLFIGSIEGVSKSGRDLVDRIIGHNK